MRLSSRGVPAAGRDGAPAQGQNDAVILLGFGLNLAQIAAVGAESLPIICSTIATALIVGYLLYKILRMDSAIATLIAVGSSICGGSAIAATTSKATPNRQIVPQA